MDDMVGLKEDIVDMGVMVYIMDMEKGLMML